MYSGILAAMCVYCACYARSETGGVLCAMPWHSQVHMIDSTAPRYPCTKRF